MTFQGTTVDELKTALRDWIDDYLEFWGERGEEPDQPFSGKFLMRMGAGSALVLVATVAGIPPGCVSDAMPGPVVIPPEVT